MKEHSDIYHGATSEYIRDCGIRQRAPELLRNGKEYGRLSEVRNRMNFLVIYMRHLGTDSMAS